MIINLPFIGKVAIGREEVPIKIAPADIDKSILGGQIDFASTALTSDTRASSKLMKANTGWVYRNNDVIAQEIGAIEFELYMMKIVGNEIEMVEINQHPILDALDRFNEFTTASDGFYLTSSHKNLAGDAFWYVERVGIDIKGIYLLQPDKVEIKLGDVKNGQAIITGYLYTDTVQGKKVEVFYKAEDVIHFKSPNPENPYRGKSKVEAAAESIDTDNLAVEANKGFFKRGMITNFVLSTDNKITPEQLKQLQGELRANYSGAANAFKAMILSGGLKPESIQMTNKDLEFIAQQEWLRDKIMVIFGNNKAILGVTDDVNRANAEATIDHWKIATIKPEMRSIVDVLNEFLIPMFGGNLILGFESPVEDDDTADVDRAVKLVNAKIITQNEARAELDYEQSDDEGADKLNMPIVAVPPAIKNVSYKKHIRRSGILEKIAQANRLKEAAIPIAKQIVEGRRKTVPVEVSQSKEFTNDQVWNYYNKQIHMVEVQEERFRQKLETYINDVVDKALIHIPDEVAEMQQKALFDEEDFIVRAGIDFTPILTEVAIASGVSALDLIGKDDAYIAMNLREAITKNVAKFAQSLLDTDREKIIDLIANGMKDGLSVPQIRTSIIKEFETYSKMQSERITRTEVIKTSNAAAVDAWEQSGVVEGKQWLTAPSDDYCEDYNGKIVSLSQNFFDKGDTIKHGEQEIKLDYDDIPEPPLHPNCKCSVIPVLVDAKAASVSIIDDKLIKAQRDKIKELEDQIDKRTKAFKDLKNEYAETSADDKAYIKALEAHLGVADESAR